MDASAFDRLARTLFRATSRRAALGALLTTAGAALGLAGTQRASAQGCLTNGERCHLGEDCCSGRCKRRNNGKKVCKPAEHQGVCTIEQNRCVGSSGGCGEESGGAPCVCVVTTIGRSFCGAGPVPETCGCTSNKKCEKQVGKGAKCAQGRDQCPTGCGSSGDNVCVTPCPTLDS
jgi:hypothetical protein